MRATRKELCDQVSFPHSPSLGQGAGSNGEIPNLTVFRSYPGDGPDV
jgi:hypothetical protein